MTNGFDEMILNMTDTTPEPEDYTGEDGLLYCGKCHKPKEGYFPKETAAWLGRDRHPAECDCQRAAREEREAAEKRRRHLDTVEELKRRGFTDPTMRDWTFENDNGRTRRPGLPAGMWNTGRICEPTISAACSGAAWEPGKATLRAVSQTPHGERNPRPHDELCSYPQ